MAQKRRLLLPEDGTDLEHQLLRHLAAAALGHDDLVDSPIVEHERFILDVPVLAVDPAAQLRRRALRLQDECVKRLDDIRRAFEDLDHQRTAHAGDADCVNLAGPQALEAVPEAHRDDVVRQSILADGTHGSLVGTCVLVARHDELRLARLHKLYRKVAMVRADVSHAAALRHEVGHGLQAISQIHENPSS